jgi:hypothetical protein
MQLHDISLTAILYELFSRTFNPLLTFGLYQVQIKLILR